MPIPVPATGNVVSRMRQSNITFSTWNTKDLDPFIQTALTIIARHIPEWIEQNVFFLVIETKRVKEQRQNGKREVPYSVLHSHLFFFLIPNIHLRIQVPLAFNPISQTRHLFILCNQQPLTNRKKEEKMPANLHVLIVGAGVSGLMAGALLERAGISYEVQ